MHDERDNPEEQEAGERTARANDVAAHRAALARERAGLGMETVAAKVGVRPDGSWSGNGRKDGVSAGLRWTGWRTALTPRSATSTCVNLPDDDLPIPDCRAAGGESPRPPSPDLLETVDLMARRQAWMRDELIEDGADPLAFVGCCGRDATPAEAAAAMREHL